MNGDLDSGLRQRLELLCDEGWELWSRFDIEVRQDHWHPFVASDYWFVLEELIARRVPHLRFLEWGSATGVITIMADLLGYDACGIELDGDLVRVARDLAQRHGSDARFVEGNFVPSGYRTNRSDGDSRLGTIGEGRSGYTELGHPLKDFRLVFGYPWTGEEDMMRDIMRCYGHPDATLLLQTQNSSSPPTHQSPGSKGKVIAPGLSSIQS